MTKRKIETLKEKVIKEKEEYTKEIVPLSREYNIPMSHDWENIEEFIKDLVETEEKN